VCVSEFWMLAGREFQRVGAATAKALSPRVRHLTRYMIHETTCVLVWYSVGG